MVVAAKAAGESFQTDNLLPAFTPAGIPIYRAGVQQYQIAGFENPDQLVYVISDMPQDSNTEVMLALAPEIKAFLEKKPS